MRTAVYYWVGGRDSGVWRVVAMPGGSGPEACADKVGELGRMGYVAKVGSTLIGAPEGPPSEEDFQAIRM